MPITHDGDTRHPVGGHGLLLGVDPAGLIQRRGGRAAARARRRGPLLRKASRDHWSFPLGELALYSLIVLVVTVVWLTFFFEPERRSRRRT